MSEQLALRHLRTDVLVPLGQVAIRARVDRRFHERLQLSRQHQRILARLLRRMDHLHRRRREPLRLLDDPLMFVPAPRQRKPARH